MNRLRIKRITAWLLCAVMLMSLFPASLAESTVQEEVQVSEPAASSPAQTEEKPKPTPKPEEPAQAPDEEPEQAPAEEPVEEPVEAPAEEPEQAPDEEPDDEPDEEPEQTPDGGEPGEETPATEEPAPIETPNPEKMSESGDDSDEESGSGGGGGGITVTPEPTATPIPPDALRVSVSSKTKYAVASESSIQCSIKIQGGVAPYKVSVEMVNTYSDKRVSARDTRQSKSGSFSIKCKPQEYGVHKIEVCVTDSLGKKVKDSVRVPVASRARESASKWEKMFRKVKLTGNWGPDIVAIARTQIGYKESAKNFIMEGNEKIGYTRYGAWYGSDYGKWCSMFIAFCCEYAGISEEQIPRDSNVGDLYRKMTKLGVIEPEDYVPQVGDFIFFNWKGGSDYDHIGIVEKVEDGKVHTIEGNSANKVRRQKYKLSDVEITGYCNLAKLRALVDEQ